MTQILQYVRVAEPDPTIALGVRPRLRTKVFDGRLRHGCAERDRHRL